MASDGKGLWFVVRGFAGGGRRAVRRGRAGPWSRVVELAGSSERRGRRGAGSSVMRLRAFLYCSLFVVSEWANAAWGRGGAARGCWRSAAGWEPFTETNWDSSGSAAGI